MTIAFASGKGGTGKTTFSVAFALSADEDVTFLDCDVEAPNSHFFIKPEIKLKEEITVPVPVVDNNKCTGCGICAKVCRFSAITMLVSKPLMVHELCHSCGGCTIACPENAISEIQSEIGVISSGTRDHITFYQGQLDVGSVKSPPLIRAVKRKGEGADLVMIDCPPGTSCPMVTTVTGADYAVLVTEPAPFGLNDLKIAVETVRILGIPFGVVINKSDHPFPQTEEYCKSESIPVLLRLPENRAAAEGCSSGESIITIFPGLQDKIKNAIKTIKKEAVR
ncbi:MAG: ATP-binding protein [Spirochaetia bacterium]|jgi:MinD superfamily P-loop ATPase|nr:ATP-binding protein [Spirochaetia bacterium]